MAMLLDKGHQGCGHVRTTDIQQHRVPRLVKPSGLYGVGNLILHHLEHDRRYRHVLLRMHGQDWTANFIQIAASVTTHFPECP